MTIEEMLKRKMVYATVNKELLSILESSLRRTGKVDKVRIGDIIAMDEDEILKKLSTKEDISNLSIYVMHTRG